MTSGPCRETGTSSEHPTHFLKWLADPRQDRGIHVHGSGGWTFHSYAGISATAHALAERLEDAHSDGKPARIAVLSEHAPTVLAAFGAAWLLRGAAQVLPQPLTFQQWPRFVDRVEHMTRLTGCRYLVHDPAGRELAVRISGALSGAPEPVDAGRVRSRADGPASGIGEKARDRHPEDAVLYQFTSGSTGPPKLIEVTAGNLSANLIAQRDWLGWRSGEDAWASWLPMHHDMGLVGGLFVPATEAGDLWSMSPGDFLRSPQLWLEALSTGRATVTAGPPFGYSYAAKRVGELPPGTDLGSWRVATIAAEMVTEEVLDLFTARFGTVGFSPGSWCPAYGLAETTLCVTGSAPSSRVRIARLAEGAPLRSGEPVPLTGVGEFGEPAPAAGRAVTGCGSAVRDTFVEIVDERGRRLPERHFGEIVVRGASVAVVHGDSGHGSPAAPGDRSHATGDSGFLVDGELYVVGRLGDGVKVRGEFVDCEGLEQRLAAAVGVPPERVALGLGQVGDRVQAVLLLRSETLSPEAGTRATAVARAVLGSGAELLVRPVAAGEIPKTSSGKVQRRRLWQEWGTLSRSGRKDIDHAGSTR